jgi:RNA polymerase sigma-70 factor (ECF subfamily)
LAQAILHRIAAGDRTAVQDCLNAYGGLVWSIARKMLRSQEDAEDIVQEIFVDIWKNAERYDDAQSSETTFIAMIARRRLIDRIRFMNRRISADSIEDIPTEPFTRLDENIQVVIEAKEVAAVMKDLRPEQRQVLYLSIVQGLSHQEISDATGMPLGTVKTHARRGILQAREALGLGNMQDTKEVSV